MNIEDALDSIWDLVETRINENDYKHYQECFKELEESIERKNKVLSHQRKLLEGGQINVSSR